MLYVNVLKTSSRNLTDNYVVVLNVTGMQIKLKWPVLDFINKNEVTLIKEKKKSTTIGDKF